MDLNIQNKIALITASGRGIGKAIARSLARENAKLVINSRSIEDLNNLYEELAPKTHVEIFCEDLTDSKSLKKLMKFLINKDLIPDILIHNLGGNLGITDPLCSISEWHKVQRINLEVPIEINREIIPYMQKKKWGRICHISSISGLENQGPPSYCAAKAGLIAYARSLGRYVAKDNIIINSVLPGAIHTDNGYWDNLNKKDPERVKNYLKERMAINRFGTPEEISEVVTFLCSDLASFCVGSAFLVDGGQGRVFFSQE